MDRIAVDFEGLTYASDYLFRLKNDAIAVSDSLQESLGFATVEEKRVIRLLLKICTVTFPDLVQSSRDLLQSIITEFRRADDVSDTVPSNLQDIVGKVISGVVTGASSAENTQGNAAGVADAVKKAAEEAIAGVTNTVHRAAEGAASGAAEAARRAAEEASSGIGHSGGGRHG